MSLHNKSNALNVENISFLSKKTEIFMEKVSSLYLTLLKYDYPINTFHASVLFLHPLKTSKHLWLSNIFREYKQETSGMKWVSICQYKSAPLPKYKPLKESFEYQ